MIIDSPIGSNAQDFFTRLREGRERLQGQSISSVLIDESNDVQALTNHIIENSDATNISTGTVGTSFGELEPVLMHRMVQDMMRNLGIPQALIDQPTPDVIQSSINSMQRWSIASSDLHSWNYNTMMSIPAALPFFTESSEPKLQEKHVTTISEEKRKELEILISAAGVAEDKIVQFTEAVHNFYLGYSEGAERTVNNSAYRLIDRIRSAAQHWYIVFSHSTQDKIIHDLFNHDHSNLLLETANAIKNGNNPFTSLKAAVVSMDIVQRFVSELAGLLKLNQMNFTHVDQQLGDTSASRLGIYFITEKVVLTAGHIGPIDLGKFKIVVNAFDFGYCCGDSESSPDSVYKVHAIDPVYPYDESDDDDGGSHSHPHLEYEHLCFGDGLGIAGNLMRAGLAAEAFQYIERILMTYGSSPYVGLEAWTNTVSCSVCGESTPEGDLHIDGHNGRYICTECSTTCELSDELIDLRYIKHCTACNCDFDSRRFIGSNGPPVLCVNCAKEQDRRDRFSTGEANPIPDTPAFPVVVPGSINCPSCAAQLGVSTLINGVTLVENQITGYDPLTRIQTCLHCDPESLGLSDRNCEPNMREAYIWAVLYQFLPHSYIQELAIRNEDSFDTEVLKSEWRAINWYITLAKFRDEIGEHGFFATGLSIDRLVEILNNMFGYNVISELHLSRV